MPVLCHEFAARVGLSKPAVEKMLTGETETIGQLIPHIKEIVKVDIVRVENDGLAVWEGV